jgi:thiol:disulfide interchange protein DsbC
VMKYFVFLFAALLSVPAFFHFTSGGVQAFDKSGCEMDCQKCHTLTNQEVKGILKDLKAPEAEILKVQFSPVNGLWEIAINNKGKSALFYLDFSKKFIISGSIIEVKTGKNKTRERVATLQDNRRVDFSKIPLNRALVMGDVASPRKVAVFTDPDCGFCAELHKEMEKVLQEKRDIAFYIFLYPLSFHKDAYWKAKSIVCSRSLKMLEQAYSRVEIPKLECDSKEIDADIKLAEALGITGTPTLVLPDGRIHTGMMPAKQLVEYINGARQP